MAAVERRHEISRRYDISRGILTFAQRRLMPETARRQMLLVLRAGIAVTDVQHVTVLVTRATSGL